VQSIVRPFCTAQCAVDCISLDKHHDFSENIAMVRERQHLLTKDEITAFSEIGWISKKALFHADEINKMRACFENLERMSAILDATGLHEGSHFVLDGVIFGWHQDIQHRDKGGRTVSVS
jgi:hypothetical protein